MVVIFYSQLISLVLLISYCTIGNANRYQRQVIDNTNRNVNIPQQRPIGSIPLNPTNNPNIVVSNERNNQQQPINNNNLLTAASQQQMEPVRSRGFYNSPAFQPSPFTGEKPSGWFGTNYVNWVSNRDSELDKNKLAANKNPPPNNFQPNIIQPRKDGGPFFLAKVAKEYASKGEKAFKFGQFESREGHGSVCTNHDNFDGFTFDRFPCPLPAATGMNQFDQFCCGPANYQYCCNSQEFSQTQRSGYSDTSFIGSQPFPKRSSYSPSTKKILAIIIPIASFIVLTGIGILVFLYYKNFRTEQNRTRKPSGAIRLEDNYSAIPQEPIIDKSVSYQDEQ